MSPSLDDSRVTRDVLAAAREFIRREGGCVVSMSELVDRLKGEFGERFRGEQELDLIETLWADPHIDQVPHTGLVEFAWNEEPVTG